jgi:hypothetical protein
MTVGHGTGLTGRNRSRLNKLDELEDISAHTAAEAIPALFVEHHMKRASGLALMVRTIALETLPGFLRNSSGQKIPCHITNIELGYQAVVFSDII